MITSHLTESQLQDVALDRAISDAVLLHIQTCSACSNRVSLYHVTFEQLQQLAPPTLPAGVKESVLEQLRPARAKRPFPAGAVFLWSLSLLVFVGICILSYTKITAIADPLYALLTFGIVLLVIAFQVIDYNRKFRQQKKLYHLQ